MSPRPLPTSSTLLTLLTFAGVLCHVTLGQPCPSNATSPVLDDKVAGSAVLVQGRVKRKVEVSPTSRAEVEVQCVLKGGPVSPTVNVSWTHSSEGRRCSTELGADLSENHVYLLYLNRPGEGSSGGGSNFYPLTFKPDPAERKYLEELKNACGLMVQLPQGVTESKVCQPEKFVADYPLEDCGDSGSPASVGPAIPALFVACWLFPLIL